MQVCAVCKRNTQWNVISKGYAVDYNIIIREKLQDESRVVAYGIILSYILRSIYGES